VFNLLAIVLAALAFGAGPSLLATWFGALLLDYMVLRPPFTLAIRETYDVWGIFVFLVIGSAISLLSGQVASARKRAEVLATSLAQANQRMDAFLGIISHELRTPLTSLKLGLELITRRTAGDRSDRLTVDNLTRVHELATRAVAGAQRQERLVGELLDVSRIQAGMIELRLAPLDLAAVVRDAVAEQLLLSPGRTIRLTGAEQAILVVGDADRLGQVVANYLTNALKYSPSDRPVEVRVTVAGGAEPVALVQVQDEGPGLPREELARVWDHLYRVPGIEVQSGSGVGLGLGLYIVRQLVHRQGGQVGVESTPGQGTTFWFTLPLQAPAHTEETALIL
jgi:signal transduction histidine kinase